MRIGFDMVSAGSGFGPAAGGMTTYYEGLSAALCEVSAVDAILGYVPPWVRHAQFPTHPKLVLTPCVGLPEGRVGRVLYEHARLPRLARSTAADVLLSTSNVQPLRWRGPSVVVLQSMQYFFLPDPIGRLRKAYLKAAVPRSLHAADIVIAVSEAQRRDAIALFGLDPERIVSVHHGPSPWALEQGAALRAYRPPRPVDVPGPYVLSVSTLYSFKNHARLVRAFARTVREGDLPHSLVIAGREWDVTVADLEAVAAEEGVADRVLVTGAFPQRDLPALLVNADAVAYVSLYETFGHPVLEAFAFGRPLIVSDVAGAAEVAGQAAEKVDPHSVASIADGLSRVLTDDGRRRELAEAGERRLRDFSWAACARGTVAALQRAMERHE